jgi:hypothetical protein
MGSGDWFRRAKDSPTPLVTPGGSLIRPPLDKVPSSRIGATEHQYNAEREAVYDQLWGEPETIIHELIPFVPHVDVYVHPPGHAGRGYYTLVTGGMSDLPMTFPPGREPPQGRAELILYVREPREDHFELLQFLAHYPHDAGRWLAHGHTLPSGDPPEPFFPDSELSVILLIESIVRADARLPELLQLEGQPVELLWVVPITEPECELKLEEGLSALMKVFQRKGLHHVLHEQRPSLV